MPAKMAFTFRRAEQFGVEAADAAIVRLGGTVTSGPRRMQSGNATALQEAPSRCVALLNYGSESPRSVPPRVCQLRPLATCEQR